MSVEITATEVAAAAVSGTMLAIAPQDLSMHLLTVFGGFVGTMHSVARIETPTRVAAAWFVFKWVMSAVVLTSLAAYLIEAWSGFPAQRWPGVVAFLITFLADRWPQWLERILSARVKAASGDTQ